MKRDFVEGLLKDKLADGVDIKELIDAIMDQNGKDLEGSKGEIDKLKAEIDTLNDKLNTATEALDGFKDVDVDELKNKIKELGDQLDAKDAEHAAKIAGMEFDAMIEKAIAGANGKSVKAIKALLDIDTLKASKNQENDIKASIDGLRESDAYLFESQEPIKNPTGGTGSGGGGDDAAAKALRQAMGLPAEK